MDECLKKYNNEIYQLIEKVFKALPLAHVINHSIFVVHGGLCRDQALTLSGLQKIDRFIDPPPTSTVHDLLWSDPMNGLGFRASERCDNGQTMFFGIDVTERFLNNNKLKLIVRSHQVQDAGFSISQNGKCVTVFSAPNYMGNIGNKGAIIKYLFDEDGEIKSSKIFQFDSVQPW